ncbi:MAG: hypothetical protein JNG86_01880 [Verrucomicrobiaceae bacterium]|nr:hypothetical protein [Verrucomicrobiaceae bacterium]
MKTILVLFALAGALMAQQAAPPAPPAAPAAPSEEPLSLSDLIPLPGEEEPLSSASMPPKPSGPVDPDLPQPFDPTVLTQVVENSPFTRIVSVSDSLVLTGVAYVDGKPVVTLLDKSTKESLVVTDQPNLRGWTLVEATPSADITRAQAKISIGGEPVSIRYDASALTKDALKKDKSSPSPGGPPPPPGGERYSRGGRGPSDEDRQKFESLSEKAKEKFRDGMREMFSNDKFRNASEEDRRNAIRSMFDKIQKDDQKK